MKILFYITAMLLTAFFSANAEPVYEAGNKNAQLKGEVANNSNVKASTTTIYENDFENPPYPEWSFNTTQVTNWDFADGNIQLINNEITVGLVDQIISGDFTVSMDILWEADKTAGIVFHAQDFVNHVFVDLKPTGNGLRLRKATGALSGFTLLTQVATTFDLDVFHHVIVTYNDTDKSLTVTMNDQILLDNYVIVGGFDSGKIGIYGNWSPLRFDNILITKPTKEEQDENQIANSDFEEDNLPWYISWGETVVNISRDTNSELNGVGSLKVEVPTASTISWDAGVRYSQPVLVEKGESYIFSFRAKADVRRTFHFDVKINDDLKFLNETFDIRVDARNFAFGFTATESGPVKITMLPTAHGATMYFDDFSLVKVTEEQVPNGDFEEEYFPWEYAWGQANASFTHDKTSAMVGEGSLKIEIANVGAAWDAGIRNAFHMYVEEGNKYEFTFDAKASEARDLYFDVVDIWRGYGKLLENTVALTTDKQTFSYTFTAGVSDVVRIQWMPTAAAATVYIDNVSLKTVPDNQIANSDFEEDNLPWFISWGETVVNISRDTNSELNGVGSLKVEVPTASANSWDAGVRYSHPVLVEKDESYIFSFRAKANERRTFHYDVKINDDLKFLNETFDIRVDARNFAFGFTATESGPVKITMLPTAHGATMYFDDFSFVKVTEEQVTNGNFEEDTLAWEYAWGAENANFSIDNNSALNDDGSLMIEVLNPSTTGAWWDAGIRNAFPVYVKEGQKYEFKFDAKAAEARKMHFDVKVGETKFIDKAIDLTSEKQTFTFSFVSSETGMVTIQWMPTFAGATVYIDNISFTEADIILVESIVVAGTDNATSIDKMGGTLQMVATFNPENADTKNVTWSVVNGTGEAAISDKGLLTAIKNGTVTVKATATDGSLKEGEVTITITGQETGVDNISSLIKVYPNPVVNTLTVSSVSSIESVEIISYDGKLINSLKTNSPLVHLSVENLKSGIYMLRIIDENSDITMRRFMKK